MVLMACHTYSGEHAHNRVQQSQFRTQPILFEASKLTANGVSKHKLDVSSINVIPVHYL